MSSQFHSHDHRFVKIRESNCGIDDQSVPPTEELANRASLVRIARVKAEAVKPCIQFPKKKAHFTCGVPEEAFMGRQVAPQEEAEAEGAPRLMPGSAAQQEEAEAEGAPRLMPGCDHDYKQKKH